MGESKRGYPWRQYAFIQDDRSSFYRESGQLYFKKALGCHVWDLDGNRYTDVSIMGIGTNILGYGNPEVDEVVAQTVAQWKREFL